MMSATERHGRRRFARGGSTVTAIIAEAKDRKKRIEALMAELQASQKAQIAAE
ncbi:hypothetical protein ACFSC1_12220 [Paracoccus aurantiacus]|uniref:hypothetical protein n=1 Tax=Paracoccus aurantiacus TaxID=2599412 RepID=UPI00164ABB35|nr:hypothetical protein [Paracoccus aurantiacus]